MSNFAGQMLFTHPELLHCVAVHPFPWLYFRNIRPASTLVTRALYVCHISFSLPYSSFCYSLSQWLSLYVLCISVLQSPPTRSFIFSSSIPLSGAECLCIFTHNFFCNPISRKNERKKRSSNLRIEFVVFMRDFMPYLLLKFTVRHALWIFLFNFVVRTIMERM